MGSLQLKSIRKAYGGHEVLKGIDLEVKDGEFVIFVGPSGCGKSTLLRTIAGLEDATSGSVQIDGVEVGHVAPAKRGIAMVFQSYALYPHMSVRDNLAFGLKMARTDRAEIERRVGQAAEILKIAHLLDRRPGQLSGGQRQRVAIGRAIVREPDVFLFDEPLSNLDAELRVSMRVEIARLHRELGNTMIYVTHDQTEAMTLADQIVILRDGRVEQTGTPRDVYENPLNTFVAGFIGSPRMNLLDAEWRGSGKVRLADSEIEACLDSLQAGERIVVGMRPEHIRIVASGPDAVKATVEFTEYLGGTRYVYCKLGDAQNVVVELREGDDIPSGSTVWLTAPSERRRYFGATGARVG